MGASLSNRNNSVLSTNKLSHHFHQHILKLVSKPKGFVCKACGLPGMGLKYGCKEWCDWDIRVTCATCPEILSTHIHPGHRLNCIEITDKNKEKGRQCGVSVMSYFLHPTCSTYSSLIKHPLDNHHSLVWKSGPRTWCSICRTLCPNWHYGCEPCSIDVHFECASSDQLGNGGGAHGNGMTGPRENVSGFLAV
ncbi:hypothetical protein MKW98_003682 [Papaver atlanticum]|uniref:DC1 domain-containing protein n=1 Tax=Papaver atlanticum TaxID=357466 RepID=A0AAD4SIH8_9MAGN|nr:hypothetical protein MKW98_003682 [Papaver atlanticum]